MFSYGKPVQLFGLSLLMLLAGCSKKHPKPLARNTYSEKRDGIELCVKRLSGAESHKQFGRNLVNLGYQPIKITILNDSTDQLLIRASAIDLQLMPAQQVCKETQRSVLALLAGPAYLSIFFAWPVLVPIIGIGAWLSARNHFVKTKIGEKFFGEDKVVELLPYERLSRYMFVPTGTPIEHVNLYLFKRQEKVYVPFTVTLP